MNPAAWSRQLWAAAFVSNAAWIGFVVTAFTVARLVAGPSSVPAPATVVTYGLGGAVFAAIVAAFVTARLRPKRLRAVAIAALILAAMLAALIAIQASRTQT
jgi:hypothetical protein